MGSPVLSGVTLLSVLLYLCSVWTQELRDRDALCNENSCLVLYWQRKIFLEAWRSCKREGGNLVTIKTREEAKMVETLFSNMELREDQRIRIWIGLQRQPRKCSPTRPMRGFSWVTGEQDLQYTNWEQEESPNTCSASRCVSVSYTTAAQERHNNLKWKDGPCSVPLDGYVCRYAYLGMCPAIRSEGGGNALYTTPFHLVSAFLTHIPFGSVATVPCLTKDDQTVLCTQKEDGTLGWNADPPFCSVDAKTSLCHNDKGGCHHKCIEDESHYYCDCNEGFILAEDGMTCVQMDPCQDSPCEFECLAVMDSYRCACPEGYMLAPDERGCLDVDECLQSPCEHICVNAPGTFECHCRDGYQSDEEGTCEDVDECADFPCEHDCENVMGSHICHCRLGFAPLPEDPSRCYDVDECQFKETCEQMCINYNGGFECYCKEGYELQPNSYSCTPISEDRQSATVTPLYPWITQLPDSMWVPQGHEYLWTQEPDYETETETESLDLLTEPPNMQTVSTDLLWLTDAPQEDPETTPPTESPQEDPETTPPTESPQEDPETTPPTESPQEDPETTPPTESPQEDPETTPPSESPSGNPNEELIDFGRQTVSVEAVLPFTTSTPPPEYYEDERTTVSTAPPTFTKAGGAGMLFSFTPKEHEEDFYDYESTTHEPELPTSTQPLPSTQGTEESAKDVSNSEQTQSNSWLLIGLLVPLCIFIVVMVVLGIIYYTRYTAKPQTKNATDCYHWIAGAGDKAAADMSAGGLTKV